MVQRAKVCQGPAGSRCNHPRINYYNPGRVEAGGGVTPPAGGVGPPLWPDRAEIAPAANRGRAKAGRRPYTFAGAATPVSGITSAPCASPVGEHLAAIVREPCGRCSHHPYPQPVTPAPRLSSAESGQRFAELAEPTADLARTAQHQSIMQVDHTVCSNDESRSD